MTEPVPLSEWEYPWLTGQGSLSNADNLAGDIQERALTAESEQFVRQNSTQNQRLIDRYNRLNTPGPGIDSAPGLSTVQIDQAAEQLAFEELLVRSSHMPADGARPEVVELLADQGFTAAPISVPELPEVTVLRIQDANGPLTAERLKAPLRILWAAKIDASLNQCPPLGYTAKSVTNDSGPRPSQNHPPNRLVSTSADDPIHKVAVIDTGIADQARQDHWLDGIPTDQQDIDPLYLDQSGVLSEIAGHGTFVSGVIRQVDTRADIRMYGVFGSDGIAGDLDVAKALLRAVQDGVRIVNLSLGTVMLDNRPPVATMVALELIAQRETDVVVVVCAAGNNKNETEVFPAAFSRHQWKVGTVRVVAVAGLERDSSGAGFSSRGRWVDCSTLARLVLSTFVQGTQVVTVEPVDIVDPPDHWPPVVYGPDSWALWTGTSFAAPQVTGAITRAAREQDKSVADALDWLLTQGTDLSSSGFGRALQILPDRNPPA
jgi:subtilisin family serine protease